MRNYRAIALLLGAFLALPTVFADGVLALSIVSPTPNQIVSGVLSVSAAADADGLGTLTFQIDGQNVGASITSGACRVIVDTTALSDGSHSVRALGVDTAGGSVSSPAVTFTVDNSGTTPTPTPTPAGQLASVVVTPSTINEGQTAQATANDASGASVVGVTWSTEHPVVSIDAAGNITNASLAAFPNRTSIVTFIRATVNGLTREAPLTVVKGPAPTPTPSPTPTPTQSPTATEIAAAVAAGLSGQFQSLTTMLQALMIPPPTLCPVTITSVSAPYANGDYKFTVRAPQGCLAAPVTGKSLRVVK